MPPSRVVLHIGLHKTGTTYLQNVLRANRRQLHDQGVAFLGGPGQPDQSFAVLDLQGRRPRGVHDRRISGQWDALVTAVGQCPLSTALISEERLSLSTVKQVRRAVAAFPDSSVEVVVTARDLARVAVSAWQEEIKNDQTWTWPEFSAAVQDPEHVTRSPARGFWLRQDLVRICSTWEAAVPPHRITIVTVPRSGTSPQELLHRFASVVGFDAEALTEAPAWSNENVGVAGTEVIRRVNERLGGRLNQRAYDHAVKKTLAQHLARRSDAARIGLPADQLQWVSRRADETVEALRSRSYRVVGDLDELRPQRRSDVRRPDDADDTELLDASIDALAFLTETYATSWWARKKSAVEGARERGGIGSRVRRVAFSSQQRAASLADRSPVAAKALGVVLRSRDRARTRAARRS